MGDSRTQFGTVEHTKFQAMFVEGIHKLKNGRTVGWMGGRKGTLGKKTWQGTQKQSCCLQKVSKKQKIVVNPTRFQTNCLPLDGSLSMHNHQHIQEAGTDALRQTYGRNPREYHPLTERVYDLERPCLHYLSGRRFESSVFSTP